MVYLRWSPGLLQHHKEASLSYKSTNKGKHSAYKSTNRMPQVSKLQVTNAELKKLLNSNISYICFAYTKSKYFLSGSNFSVTLNGIRSRFVRHDASSIRKALSFNYTFSFRTRMSEATLYFIMDKNNNALMIALSKHNQVFLYELREGSFANEAKRAINTGCTGEKAR